MSALGQASPAHAAATRPLTAGEADYVDRARAAAHELYEGRVVAHRSCGEAIAETFSLPSRSYLGLRRGGFTGQGDCGAMRAGELVLAELMSPPGPGGGVPPALRSAVQWYQDAVATNLTLQAPTVIRLSRRPKAEPHPGAPGTETVAAPGLTSGTAPRPASTTAAPDLRCNTLTAPFPEFHQPARAAYCTSLAAQVAALTAEALCRFHTERVALYESQQ